MWGQRRLWTLGFAAVLFFGGIGCSTIDSLLGPDEPKAREAAHYFEDVKVPPDLSLDRDDSFLFESGGFKRAP